MEDEVKLFVCLVIEIVMHKELRVRTYLPELDERLNEDLKFLHFNNTVPRLTLYFISVLISGMFLMSVLLLHRNMMRNVSVCS